MLAKFHCKLKYGLQNIDRMCICGRGQKCPPIMGVMSRIQGNNRVIEIITSTYEMLYQRI